MFQKNTLPNGLLIGILLPVAVFFLLFNLFSLLGKLGTGEGIGLSENFRERTSAILAIAINLVPMNAFRDRRFDAAMRGIVISTALLAVGWVVYYGMKLM